MARVTIKQIAKLAGVSVPAVSYVLNGKKGVSEETRQRILKIIDDLHYTPNVNSRRLILQRSFNILVSLDTRVSTLENMFYTEVLNAMTTKANELGYDIVLSTDDVMESKDHLITILSEKNADGIIFLRDIPSNLQSSIEDFGTPFVVVDSQKTDPPYYCVKSDTEIAAYTATKYLASHGHEKIAFIGMDRLPDFYLRTFTGYKRALSEFGLQIQPNWIQTSAYNEVSARRCMEAILDDSDLPTAVFCAGDIYAIGAMNQLQSLGYRIPDDFSFISLDDIVLARFYYPPLTTVQVDKYQMGSIAITMLDGLIRGEEIDLVHELPFSQIIERNTVRNLY